MKIKKDTMGVNSFMYINDDPSLGLGAEAELSKNFYPYHNLPSSGSTLLSHFSSHPTPILYPIPNQVTPPPGSKYRWDREG